MTNRYNRLNRCRVDAITTNLQRLLRLGRSGPPINIGCMQYLQTQTEGFMMSSIPSAVSQVLLAQNHATQQKIGFAVLGKSLDAQKQAGDAAVALIEQAVDVQKQLASGHIDVRL